MPVCFDNCRASLVAGGMEPRKANRAAHFAFWQQHKMTPAAARREGLECSCDLSPLAAGIYETLAAQTERQVIALDETHDLAPELTCFADLTIDPPGEKIPHALREVRVIQPGTYKGHEWTLADLQEIEAAFDPADPPPILVQHEESAGARVGYVRALRLRDDGWLWALGEFIGTHATEQVVGKLWDQTSAGLVIAPYQALDELSVVHRGAVPGSAIQKNQEVSTMNVPPVPGSGATQAAAAAPTPPAQETPAPSTAALAAGLQQVATALGATAPQAPAAETKIVADMQAEMQAMRAELDEQKRVNRLAEDTKAVLELMRSGRSVPEEEVRTKELAFIGKLSADLRTEYLALRNALPQVWPTGRTALADMTRPAAEKAGEEAQLKRLSEAMKGPSSEEEPASGSTSTLTRVTR